MRKDQVRKGAHRQQRRPSVVVLFLTLSSLLLSGCGSGGRGAAVGLPPLLNPAHPEMTTAVPDSFRVLFETTKGHFVVDVRTSQAPLGATRFYHLVRHGFYDGTHFFRVLQDFVAQFGIHRDPEVSKIWQNATITDDPVVGSNRRGTLTFGTAGPNTRATQLFINLANNSRLDALGFAPFGQVTEGMEVVEQLYSGYGEGAPMGNGPDQARILSEGATYLENAFPRLDRVLRAQIVQPTTPTP